ncbi:MAG: SDR family NAD(P)-dependent oxidoreductase [Chitinophagaceae bacterium]|nr:SDR family NAD(P)-dependent oxidoreductase [Chitinophagaceae bacterium]
MPIVLITGASSGFGAATAKKFAANGYDLILTARRKERLDALAGSIQENTGVKTHTLVFDVRDKEAVDQAIEILPEHWKQIDILINNAGLAAGRAPFDQSAINDWETMIDTNVKGLIYVTRAVLPFMIVRKKGHIINIGSTAGNEVYQNGNVYCATKFAVDALSQSMRIDLLPHAIKVTNIKPGAAETEFSLVRFKGDASQAAKVYEGFKALQAEDVADIIYYTTTLPAHVCINDLTVTPLAQATVNYIQRDK